MVPDGLNLPSPRFFSQPHPRAVRSLADEVVPWLREVWGLELRPWQVLVLTRALEVDEGGRLCWRNVVVSTGRQLGKSWLMAALALARCGRPDLFGEGEQHVIHIANNLHAARRVMFQWVRRAEELGVSVRRGVGMERFIWPDGGEWALVAGNSVWGSSANMALADECWDLSRDVIDQGVVPTMVARSQPQLWLFSTANPAATDLMPAYRADGMAGDGKTAIAEWSASPDADAMDPATWRAASAWWDEQRAEFMDATKKHPGFAAQWLNVWPTDALGKPEWPRGWSGLQEVAGAPVVGGIGAVEASRDRKWWGVCVVAPGDKLRVWTGRFSDLEEARTWMQVRAAGRVFVGASHRELWEGPWEVVAAGGNETYEATPLLQKLVDDKAIEHDHSEAVAAQTQAARLSTTDKGVQLSGKASRGPVEILKAIGWACLAATRPQPEAPAIW
jgi:hypothetical protein